MIETENADSDQIQSFEFTFSADTRDGKTIPFIPTGDTIELTESNKADFITLSIRHRFVSTVLPFALAMRVGIIDAIGPTRFQILCNCLEPETFRTVIWGDPEVDVEELIAFEPFNLPFYQTSFIIPF